MKKITERAVGTWQCQQKKLWRIMKLSVMLLIAGILQVSAASFGQNTRLTINLKGATLEKVFDEIENQSEFSVFYNKEIVNENSRVNVVVQDADIEKVLDEVLKVDHFKYHIIDKDIIITKQFLQAKQQEQKHKVTGKITDDTGDALPGVNVYEKENPTNGVITGIDGSYTIEVSSPDAAILYSFIGFDSQEIIVAGRSTLDITLVPESTGLNEVVVTALGIKRDKKALGYAFQDVKSEDLNETGDPDVVSALEGKVAGLNISQSGSGTGGSTKITIRGNTSLSNKNEPLWVIDGIPFDNSQSDEGGEWGGVDRAGVAFDINPNDIESISVLKGASAAALYGSRAANGVILVTTKKGKTGQKGLGISYSGSVVSSKVAYFLDQQSSYGQGMNGVYDKNSNTSWGPKMEGQMLESWTGETIPYTAQEDRLEEFFQTGLSQAHNLSFTGASDKGTFRASIGHTEDKGVYKGHKITKNNFDLRSDYKLTKFFSVDSKISYINTKGNDRPEMGNYSIISYFNTMPMNIRNQDLEPGYVLDATGNHVEVNYAGPDANDRNPYFLQEQQTNEDDRYRVFGYLAGNIQFTDNLKLKLKHGIDFYRERISSTYKYTDNVYSNDRPKIDLTENFFKEENTEFLLTYNKQVSDFSIGLSAGGNRMYQRRESLIGKSGKIDLEGAYFLSIGTKKDAENDLTEKKIHSVYGLGQVSFRDYLFVDITARNDWSSTLPSNNRSYFYPSVSVSGIVSEMTTLPSWVTFLKIRGSWAQVGNDTDPYGLYSVYETGTGAFQNIWAHKGDVLLNPDLKPEITTSAEVGVDLKLFNNRLGVDAAYYSTNTVNQVLDVPLDQSAGFRYKRINAGEIRNKGTEIMIYGTPVKTSSFRFDVDLNLAKNISEVTELTEGVDEFTFGEINNGPKIVAIEGHEMGEIRASAYQRDANGKMVVDDKGLPIATQSKEIIGSIQPDWTGSLKLAADYKGLFCSALMNFQKGGEIISLSEAYATSAGTAKRTEDRADVLVDGVTSDGTVNTKTVSAQEYWTRVSGIYEEFLYDASFIKLKELAVGYNVPKSLLERIPSQVIKTARVSFVGRNLFYLHKNTPGTVPDASAFNRSIFAQGFDLSAVPSTRTLGFSINLGF
ncbi:SusC/RagA family TonB-linked outer membrane protein [Marinilabiliaceae bacterium JC017]|nr:SusC/RagA family TonB-linked outer membrane protein [Marinilabiliaceae bacterium JC017]